jgi:hypothetical protein
MDLTGSGANNETATALKQIPRSDDQNEVIRRLRRFNYTLERNGWGVKQRQDFWSEVETQFQATARTIAATDAVKQAAGVTIRELSNHPEPTERIELQAQTEAVEDDTEDSLQGIPRKTDTRLKNYGIGHVEKSKRQNPRQLVLDCRVYDKDEVVDLQSDRITAVDLIARIEPIRSFEVYHHFDGERRRIYHTDPQFPESGYEPYAQYQGFELRGRYIDEFEQEPFFAGAHVFAVKEGEEGNEGFTQLVKIDRRRFPGEPSGVLEALAIRQAESEARRRIDHDDFERDAVYEVRYSELVE